MAEATDTCTRIPTRIRVSGMHGLGLQQQIQKVRAGGSRNIKYKPPHFVVIFFMTIFTGQGGMANLAPPPPGSATGLVTMQGELRQWGWHKFRVGCQRSREPSPLLWYAKIVCLETFSGGVLCGVLNACIDTSQQAFNTKRLPSELVYS